MRQSLIVSILLVVLSACTMPWAQQDTSFQGLYRANIHESMSSLDEFGTAIGLNRHESIVGTIHTAMSVPEIFSGSLSSEYVGLLDGRNSESFFRNIRVLFTSLVSSGSISADEVGIISHGADSFLSYKNLVDSGLIDVATKKILDKYENTWLSLGEQTHIGMTPNELIGYNIGRHLMTQSLSDVEKYATDYPIFHDIADLGMSGSLHFWSVDIDRAHILALSKQLSLDFAGTGMTDVEATALQKHLETASFSGKIGFDPTHPQVSILDGAFSISGSLIAQIMISRDHDEGHIRITQPTQQVAIEINSNKQNNRYTFDAVVRQSNSEKGKMVGYIDRVDEKFHELSIEASAQGMTMTLKHTVEGNHFTGKLSAIVGTIEWSGTTGDDGLKNLKINSTAPFGTFTADLIESTGGMVRGPIVVKSDTEVLLNANLALAITSEKLAIILDVLSESFPVHFDIDIEAKSTPSQRSVLAPTGTQLFQKLSQEIAALASSGSEFIDAGSQSDIDSGAVLYK